MALQALKPKLLLDSPAGVAAIYKPPGINFHTRSPTDPGFLELVRAGQASGELPIAGRLWPVHRLDTITSGIVLFAKSKGVASYLGDCFKNKRINKYYVALSDRKPKKKMGTVSGDMERSRRASWMLLRTTKDPAVTRFESFPLPGSGTEGMRMYVLKPETGRTHQLRVCMKSLGVPVLGDELYANANEARKQERAYLHAAAIRLHMGSTRVAVVCPPMHGALFLEPAFQAAFRELFSGCSDDQDVWFARNTVLRSSMPAAPDAEQLAIWDKCMQLNAGAAADMMDLDDADQNNLAEV